MILDLNSPKILPAMPIELQNLTDRSWAEVVDVVGETPDVQRLKALGVCAGRRLQILNNGEPLIVRVMGSHIGISGRLAESVKVRPLASAPMTSSAKQSAPLATVPLETAPLPTAT